MTIETVLEFGPDRRLVGILTQPAGVSASHRLAIVITNSGIIHRVGANRVHVRLARHLASLGVPCLRYDLPGIGDSDAALDTATLEKARLQATRMAFDALQQSGIAERFVMIGLCSGADHSFEVSCADQRVHGVVLLDPTTMFATPRHQFNQLMRLVQRASKVQVWRRLLKREITVLPSARNGFRGLPDVGAPTLASRSVDVARGQAALEGFRTLVRRDVRLFLIITQHNREVYSYERQLFDAFPELPELESLTRVARRLSAQHTFSDETDRQFLESSIADWLADSFPAAT